MVADTRKTPANAKTCSMSLLLLLDESYSISDENWQHQVQGTADALERPDIVQMFDRQGGVALSVRTFDDTSKERISWNVVRTQKDASELAAKIRGMTQGKGATNIGLALTESMNTFANTPCQPHSKIIDISTDADNNNWLSMEAATKARQLKAARESATELGVVINGIGVDGTFHKGENVRMMLERDVITENGFAVGTEWKDYRDVIYKKLGRELLSEVKPPITPAVPDKSGTQLR